MDEDGMYRTSDLYYASFLKAAGVPFQGAVLEGALVFFIFERVDGLRDLKNGYYNRSAQVSALDFAEAVKALKPLLFTIRGNDRPRP